MPLPALTERQSSMKKKIALAGALLIGAVGLFGFSGYFAYKSIKAPSSLFMLETGRGAESMTSLDHYLATLSFVAALAILAFVRKYWMSS